MLSRPEQLVTPSDTVALRLRPRYAPSMLNLTGKHVLIFGVASEESIAWAIAKKFHQAGARISLGYQMRFKSRIMQLVKKGEIPIEFWERCDVTQPEELEQFFTKLPGSIDVLVHSIAYASPESLAKPVHQVNQDEFGTALVTSSYSLIPLVRAAADKMSPNASVIAMTYLGGQRVVANYRLMGIAKAALEATVRELAADLGTRGIRINAISAGPIKTLAASQIQSFNNMLEVYEKVAPLRRCVTQADVGNTALFLGSELSEAITGQVIYTDAGYSVLAMAELPTTQSEARA